MYTKSFCWWLLLFPFIVIAVSHDPSKEHAEDIITSAINGYAALLDRMGKIYQILSNPQTYDNTQQEFLQRNRRKIERGILRNDDEQEIINELLTQYEERVPKKTNKRHSHSNKKTASPYYIPIIDDILGLNDDDIEPEPQTLHGDTNKKQNNAQYEYIRRRLSEEPYEDIVCDNNKTSPYDTDYKFKFKPFNNCTVSLNSNDAVLHTTDVITTIYTLNETILYSSTCEFMLILNETMSALQIMASQQTNPVWSSSDNALFPISNINGSLAMQFNSDNGELDVYDGNTVMWTNMHDALWKDDDAKYAFVAPFHLALDALGSLYVMDHNQNTKWQSSKRVNNEKLNARENIYRVNLSDSETKEVLHSMSMAVFLVVSKEKIFYLYFKYVAEGNVTNTQQKYTDVMYNLVYKFNVSVYELQSPNLGDTYVVYDASLPMIYSLLNDRAQTLSIGESDTFLCIDNETRYFNVEVMPFAYEMFVESDDNNYTVNIYAEDDTNDNNYTFSVDPWNPCNYGVPVLAQKSMRECFVTYDIDEAISEFNKYSENGAYSNINMKYIGFETELSTNCVREILAGNNTNITVTTLFPSNFSADSCTNYMIDNMTKVNEYFNSDYCEVLRTNCVAANDGYYDICLDFTHKLCTCYCPRDKKGTYCEQYRDYACKLNILNANMTECEAMTQEELNAHGRSDYDVTLDGDKPCFYITDTIESVVQLSCKFVDGESAHSQVWESLSDYTYDDNISVSFEYCLGNETSPFASTSAPPKSYLRLKLFNFARIFSDNETYRIALDINHWSGNKYVFHNRSMDDLHPDYKIGGRIYIEYQLWQTDEDGYTQNRMNVERRFYDIDHWQMPMDIDQKYDSTQRWFIAICTIAAIVLTVYCVSQCNKWCKKLDHEKND